MIGGNFVIRVLHPFHCHSDISLSLTEEKNKKKIDFKQFRDTHTHEEMTMNSSSVDSMRKVYDHVWHWIAKQTYESTLMFINF